MEHCPTLAVEALKLAIDFVKENTHNTQMYAQLHKKLAEQAPQAAAANNLPDLAGGPASVVVPPLDQAWIDQRSKKAALKLEKLDTDFKNYKSNSIKVSN